MPFIKSIYFYLLICVVCTVLLCVLENAIPFKSSSVLITFIQVSFWGLMVRGLLLKLLVKRPVYNAWRE